MRRLRLVFGLVVLAVLGGTQLPADAATTDTQIYWGATLDGARYGFGSVPRDMRAVQAFEAKAGKPMSIIPFGNSWMVGGVLQPFDPVPFNNVRAHGSIPLYSWQSQGGPAADFQNARIAAGAYDAYIHTWARAARGWGHPFLLKFDHEMDGSWYPWGEGSSVPGGPIANGNTPGSFIAMWRHVHDIFVQESATNVTWVWVVNEESTIGRYPPLSQIYPGDDYVDWTGIDAYNRYPATWASLGQMLHGWPNPNGDPVADTYQLVQNVAPGKPMMIPEFGTIEDPLNPDSKPTWLRDAYLTQIARNFPAIKAVVYFDRSNDDPTLPVESSPAAQTAFTNSISLSSYATNVFGQLAAGRITPPTEQVAYLTSVTDTYIASDAPTSVAGGSAPLLNVDGTPGHIHNVYLRFDLSPLAGKTVDRASLVLSTSPINGLPGPAAINIRFDANNSWKEPYTSWNNHGGPYDLASGFVGNIAPSGLQATRYVATLSPTFVAAHAGGLLSLELEAPSAATIDLASREASDPNLRPQLVIAYR